MKKMETTVYQSNISIFHKSLDLLISSILNNNNTNQWQVRLRSDIWEFFNDTNIIKMNGSGGCLEIRVCSCLCGLEYHSCILKAFDVILKCKNITFSLLDLGMRD